jgi:hypothetical protein
MKTARMILLLVLAAVAGVSLLLVAEHSAERKYDDAVRPYLPE